MNVGDTAGSREGGIATTRAPVNDMPLYVAAANRTSWALRFGGLVRSPTEIDGCLWQQKECFVVYSKLWSLVMLVACVGFVVADKANADTKDKSDKKAKEAKITKVDSKKSTVTVKTQSDNKEVEKTFKLAEDIEYMDSTGKVATLDIFTSGDLVLIIESDGTISKMTKKDKTEPAKKPVSK